MKDFKHYALRCGAVWAAAMAVSLPVCRAVAQAPEHACSAPEYRQFDFWIGDWDAFDVTDQKAPPAHVRVESILDGCVLKETYEGRNGEQGQSFSIYDRSRGVWHQTWVTNRGALLTIEGKFEGGAMVLAGSDRASDGKKRLVRGVWKLEAGGVHEHAVTSTDSGATWTPWFDLIFRKHGADAERPGLSGP